MLSYAILIDGGFARRRLGSVSRPVSAQTFNDLVLSLQGKPPLDKMRLHRVYYYDSVPLQTSHMRPLQGAMIEFGSSEVAKLSRDLFDGLAKLPFMALRLGELSFNGWKINPKLLDDNASASIEINANDLRPQIAQKGVDMRIGMDIAALTLKKQVQAIVLVSGDSDFIPAMKFARREGANLFLAPLGQRVKATMLEHSDLVVEV
jgi:uncharacterized LabA/DUF88 family protein